MIDSNEMTLQKSILKKIKPKVNLMSSLYYISKSITNQAFLNYLYLHNASSDRLKHLIKIH